MRFALAAPLLLAFAMGAAPLAAQQAATQSSPFTRATQGTVPANPADVGSIDALLGAVYDVISGPAGERRDWNRMRSLFASNARMMPNGAKGLRSGTVEDYIATSGPVLEERGFFERELARRVEQYGDIAHVFSTYEARQMESGPVFMRGINSFQLVRHDGRWWVVSIMWQAETPQTPLPAEYLTSPNPPKKG